MPQAIEIAEICALAWPGAPSIPARTGSRSPGASGSARAGLATRVDQILARADAALYDAKLGGRNRVVGAHAGILTRPAIVTNGHARASAL